MKLRYWNPETASILSQGPPRLLRPQKRDTIADALPRNSTFRRNFRLRGPIRASLGENQNSLYDNAGPFILGGDHIPTSNKVISSVFQAVRAHFLPQK